MTAERGPSGRVARPRLAACALGVLLGCGYSTSSLMPEGVQSIAVEIAGNETFYRGDEFVYTRHLAQELIRRTHIAVRDRRDADAVLTTRILGIDRAPLVEDRSDQVIEEGVFATVDVTLTERATGRVITRFKLTRRAEGILIRGETLDTTRVELMQELAEDTVVRLQDLSFLAARGYRTP